MSLASAGDLADVAFLGASWTTDAFFAKPSVANVYLRGAAT
jgi:hypothetical protein